MDLADHIALLRQIVIIRVPFFLLLFLCPVQKIFQTGHLHLEFLHSQRMCFFVTVFQLAIEYILPTIDNQSTVRKDKVLAMEA